MKISILAVGTELLMGKTINSNATYLSKEINKLGHSVMYHLTIGDNPKRLEESLKYLLSISDMVITTGGLGPTKDDLTKEVIADTFNQDMELNEIALYNMKSRFKSFNVKMTENNLKQAYIPKNSILMNNQRGTAPGFITSYNDQFIAALPGPPREMKHMFDKDLKPFLESKSDSVIVSEYINLFGIGESTAASIIDEIIEKQSNPTIAIYANVGQVSIRVTALSDSDEKAKELLKPTINEISDLLSDYIIGYGEKSLLDLTIEEILKNKYTLSLAESCTGGLIASTLINKSGASDYFDSGYVTYSNNSKERILGVKKEILEKYGAVSEETCYSMVEGLYNISKTNICLSVTGIAGPLGGTKEKPVGLVYIGVNINGIITVKKYNFTGDRNVIRQRTLLNALNDIRTNLLL